MEVIEDGNIMDRIPILLQRDLEYYQKNQTVLSETICKGVVGGRLDFPRNASFASVKIVLWLEEEFSIAFKQGSGMFVETREEDKGDFGVAKTSDPDKFVQLAIKSGDSLLEHLHMLAQEALDHADLPVLTATLGAAALLKNSLYCYVQHIEDSGNPERYSLLQGCYKRYTTMSEAVGERVLDLHNRVLSLYILQDSGGRPIDGKTKTVHESGTPSVQGWWLYMNGSRRDLWDTVPPRMAQRIFAGMLNETLTILTVRYCQTNTTETTTRLLLNDILNILLCVAQLLPSICANGSDLAGLDAKHQTRDVRDVHAKCNELFKCFVYRGADLHFIHQEFKERDPPSIPRECPYPWFTFVSPKLFDKLDDPSVRSTHDLSVKTALGLELIVLLAQPQPNWALIVKVLMMRDCHLSRLLIIRAIRHMCVDNLKWAADGLWYSVHDTQNKCSGFLCTADGFCKFKGDVNPGVELARAAGALTYILATIGSKAELKSTLCYALEISGRDWAACLDKRQVWCDRRPPWLAGILAIVGSVLQFIPPILVNAVQTGASMYQTMALCLSCISRSLDCIPRSFVNACEIIEGTLPSHINPVGGSILLQMLVTVTYEEIQKWADQEVEKEKEVASTANGEPHTMSTKSNRPRSKHVRIAGMGQTNTSSSLSFDGSHSNASSIALAVAEALCSIDEDDKHTRDIQLLIERAQKKVVLSEQFGLEDFPEFAELFEEGDVPGSNAERASDAAALTSQILMTSPGRDSLRVIYEHLALHSEWIYKELGIQDSCDVNIPMNKAPLLYTMFHIGKHPFDQASLDGRAILREGQIGDGILKEGPRRKLSQLLIRNILDNNPSKSIDTEEFYKLTTEICQLFPKESAVVYYSAYIASADGVKKKNASGKLYESYISRRRKLREIGDLPKSTRSASVSSASSSSSISRHEILILEDDHRENISWLRNNVESWKTVEKYWKETEELRLNKIKAGEGKIEDYFKDFPALQQKQGYTLFLRGEWPIPWSKLVSVAKAWSGLEGVRVHVNRRTDVRNMKSQGKSNKQLMQLCAMFKSNSEGLL